MQFCWAPHGIPSNGRNRAGKRTCADGSRPYQRGARRRVRLEPLEPREGHYDLDWLDRAIELAAKHHIVVVIGTPTAAPPAWLTHKYPDALRVDEDGHAPSTATAQQFSFSSPRYREFCRRLPSSWRSRFGHNPNVIGWQIDNEYGPPDVFRRRTRAAVSRLAAEQSITRSTQLNHHWTTAYWSQTYDSWDEIPMHSARTAIRASCWTGSASSPTPGRIICRIRSRSFAQHAEPRQFITTNIMRPRYDGFDHYVMNRRSGLASWDEYVGKGHLDVVRQRSHARPGPRLQAPELLGDGDPARHS